MKKLFTLFIFFVTIITFSQAPQGFNYQATVRNSAGALITNQNVYFKFNIMLNSSTSVPVFSETHYVPTDDLGQVNLIIGQGTSTIASFSSINWGNGNYYLGIELNTGSGYVAMGTTQLLSVPYALYANSSGNAQSPIPDLASVLSINNSANNNKITNLQNPTDTQDAATKGYIDTQISNLQAQITALQNANPTNLTSVTIGNQIWQSINLDVTTYRDGTPIPQVSDPTAWNNLTTGAWCYYNNDPVNGAIYGKLYNWYAVAGIYDAASLTNTSLRKQIAPNGWHVPSESECTTMIDFLVGNIAGGKMKEIGTIHWNSPNTGATNESGFTGLPGGYRFKDGQFICTTGEVPGSSDSATASAIGKVGSWWSSTLTSPSLYCFFFSTTYIAVNSDSGYADRRNGFSVRCLKD
jgi:uncharacterized protein (TIGR02145 family)